MRFSKEERRALGFIAGMVLLSVLGRWVDRPRPLDTDLEAVNLDSLEAASQAMRPARRARTAHPRTARAQDSAARAPERASESVPTTPRRAPKSSTPASPRVFAPGSAITHIVSTEERSVASSVHDAIAPVDLNTASAAELEKLPRVGPVLAARIVAYRQSVGRFENVDALASVKGVGPALLERLRPYLRVP